MLEMLLMIFIIIATLFRISQALTTISIIECTVYFLGATIYNIFSLVMCYE